MKNCWILSEGSLYSLFDTVEFDFIESWQFCALRDMWTNVVPFLKNRPFEVTAVTLIRAQPCESDHVKVLKFE